MAGGAVSLADLHESGPALLLFVSEECPTCTLTLRRLAPIVSELTAAGVRVAAVFEDPLEVAARVARRTGFAGAVLSEPAPYDVSRAYSLQSLPTAVLVDRRGGRSGRVVGWQADALSALIEQAAVRAGSDRRAAAASSPDARPRTPTTRMRSGCSTAPATTSSRRCSSGAGRTGCR